MKPRVTIVGLAYNHEKYIGEALASYVMQQTQFPFQVIVSDDCSTDGTRKIIEEYAERYPEIIKPVYRENNLGAEENFLETLSHVDSEYVVYCECDDYFTDPIKLQKQVDFLDTHPDCSICFHLVNVIFENGEKEETVFPQPAERDHKDILELEDLLKKNFMQTNSVMYRWRFPKESSIREYFPLGIIPGDWYLHLLHAQCGKIGFLDQVMSVYRRHEKGIWWNAGKAMVEHELRHGREILNCQHRVLENFEGGQNEIREKIISDVAKHQMLSFLRNGKAERLGELLIKYPEAGQEVLEEAEKKRKFFERKLSKKFLGIPVYSHEFKHGVLKVRVFALVVAKIKI